MHPVVAIWNGKEFVFEESDYSFITIAKLLWYDSLCVLFAAKCAYISSGDTTYRP